MNILERLNNGEIIIFDGAMGTQLAELGAEMGAAASISSPDIVKEVHKKYINNGSNVILTNTLTINKIYMENHDLGVSVEEGNILGAKLANEAKDENTLVAGDIGSTGAMLQPYGLYTEDQFIETFKEQAIALEKGGIDFFLIETIMDLNEAVCALKACKEVSKLPVFVSMTYNTLNNGGRTMMGNSAEECAKTLTENGADGLGANCGDLDPFEMAEIVKIYKANSPLPFLAQPNAGKPKLVDGETKFDMLPEDFGKGVEQCLKNGATLLGGCCGTSPLYIKAIKDILG